MTDKEIDDISVCVWSCPQGVFLQPLSFPHSIPRLLLQFLGLVFLALYRIFLKDPALWRIQHQKIQNLVLSNPAY